MTPVSVDTLGVDLPDGFNGDAYDTVHAAMKNRREDNEYVWDQYGAAWNALGYRFRACSEASGAFTEATRSRRKSSTPELRYVQERELFYFFSSGVAAWESLCFGVHAIAAFIWPSNFPMSSEEDLEKVNPVKTLNRLRGVAPKASLTHSLDRFLSKDNDQRTEWRRVRNVLVHRTHPGRIIYFGNQPPVWKEFGIKLDEATTEDRLSWLTQELKTLLDGAARFATQNLS